MNNFQLRERNLCQFSDEDGYLREKVLLVNNKRLAYVSTLTKIVNKITKYIIENSDVFKLQKYKSNLENTIKNIISKKLKNLYSMKQK